MWRDADGTNKSSIDALKLSNFLSCLWHQIRRVGTCFSLDALRGSVAPLHKSPGGCNTCSGVQGCVGLTHPA